jgi:hypothetical protein
MEIHVTLRSYQRKPGVYTQQMDDQVFLADPDTNVLFHLDPVGSAVWRLLEQPISIENIVDLLREAFPDEDADKVTSDVSVLFKQLSDSGLIIATDT